MNALYTLKLDEERRKRLEDLGYTIHQCDEKGPFSQEALASEVLVTFNPFPALHLSDMPHLQLVHVATTGLNQIPMEAVDRGIAVTNNPQGYSIPIGEWIVTKILESYKNTRRVYQQQEDHLWKLDLSIEELFGKKVLFIGTGNIAKEGATRLTGFGVEIVGVNRKGTPNEVFKEVISFKALADNIGAFDVVVVVLPGTKETDHIVDQALIDKMKEESVFINISRGSVVEQDALEKMATKFRAIHLDVFEEEPLPKDHPFWEMENVFVSSHTSWVSAQVENRRFENVYDNLKAFIRGEELPSLVDLNRGY